MDEEIHLKFNSYLKQYLEMDILGVKINCPYWMNKMAFGRVVLRGFLNGKGDVSRIKNELLKRLNILSPDKQFGLTEENIRKFAKREKIGIDCSGFVYRVLDELIRLNYKKCHIANLAEIFRGGIDKTSARMMTSTDFCTPVEEVVDFQLGDIIRLWEGKHIAIIIDITEKEITYAHSSSLSTKIQGVHTSVIRIIRHNGNLQKQAWEEKTRKEENFGKKHFNPKRGDGVFRLRIFS